MSGGSANPARERAPLERIAEMVLAAIGREYPYHLAQVMRADGDAGTPRALHPSFGGSFDWHSAVHGHWCLARLARRGPGTRYASAARRVLADSLAAERLEGERRTLARDEHRGFERPYGLAWLLQLGAELAAWDDREAARWSSSLEPLEALAVSRLSEWLPRLRWPVRSGEHSQTAFALGLALDWARERGAAEFERLIVERARAYFEADRDAPVAYEPSGTDFLSPALGEADLMRRVLDPAAFAPWVEGFLPDPRSAAGRRWLTPVASPDPSDGKLAHLDGLDLSRAWMLEGAASSLPAEHPWRGAFERAAAAHREAGLASLAGEHYAGTHWLGSFAAYLVTARGLEGGRARRG